MELVSTESSMHLFSDISFVNAVSLLLSYFTTGLEKPLRVFVELYLSKVTSIEFLIQAIDSQAIVLQEELLVRGDIQQDLNAGKVSNIVEILVDPCLFFVKALLDHSTNRLDGGGSSTKKYDGAKRQRVLKIKENHIILLINLARRLLEERKHPQSLLTTCISMCLISQDLQNKGLSKDCVQRILSGLAEFSKTWLEISVRENQADYTC
jgi:sulfur transfer complex TusBCD TusB component (DsrH family)